MKKVLYILLGCIGLVLGAVGAVLPLLPAFPFLMLAAYCFARSSQRLHNWFTSTKLYKNNLESFAKGRGMTWSTKLRIMVTVTLVWSREAPPCHITMVGSHHPLREPDLHLSMYPALLSFGQQLLTGCGLQHGIFCTQPAFYAVLQSLQPPMPACP